MTGWSAETDALLRLMAARGRGPEREGLFALWLLVRVLDDVIHDPLPDRVTRRRIASLERRLSSLALPAPLRRALAGALGELAEPSRPNVALALRGLVAPTRDALGGPAAELIAKVAADARSAGS
ncbi:MAG: hypothetical protein ACOY71_12995 [Gemmatimonadota bacterium]